MEKNLNGLPKELIEAADKFDAARSAGKRPLLVYDAINFPKGTRVQYSDDDTRKPKNPYDKIIEAMEGG